MMVGEAGPEGFTVRILGADGRVGGLGVLVGERHVVTCAHVVNAVLGREQRSQSQPDAAAWVIVDFPLLGDGRPLRATVAAWLPPSDSRGMGDDVAGLVIAEDPPSGTRAARLAVELARPGHQVRVFGYPGAPPRPAGSWVAATVRGTTGNGRLQIDSSQDSAQKVQPGFSGSALFDDGSGRVLGLLAAAPLGIAPERDSYAISADRLRLAWPEILAGRWQRTSRTGASGARRELTILHVSDLSLGSADQDPPAVINSAPERAGDPLFGRLHRDLATLAAEHDLQPDILIVAGGLASRGLPSEFRQAMDAIGTLAEATDIPRAHVAIVPGSGDVNRRASAAYFAEAEAEEREPVSPYWPKWKQFATAFDDFYAGTGGITFTPDEPWTLFEMPSLNVVVAGINTTMADSHRAEDHYALAGARQLRWFEGRLARYRHDGWLRIAALHHRPVHDGEPGHATGAPAGPGLRDADDFDQILGRNGLVNLSLNGASRPVGIDRLSSGLMTISSGAAAAGHYHLITLRRESLTRHARQYEAAQHRWIGDTRVSATGSDWREVVSWTATSADAALPPPDATAPEAPLAVATRDGDLVEDGPTPPSRSEAVNEFLDRVAEATRVRYPEATVTERPEENYLRVTRPRLGGAVEQWPIGVIAGPATEEALDAFASGVHARFSSADPGLLSMLVYTAPPASADLVAGANRRGIRLQSLTQYQGLLDLTQLTQAQQDRLAVDRVYPPRLYVEQRYRIINAGQAADVRDDLVARAVTWMRTDGARLVVVLGDPGRGKTSFLRQLTRVLHSEERPSVTPILVELRHLEKAPTLDELLMQHLVRQGVEGDVSTAKLRYMITSGRVALLFDGFDELELRVGYDHAAEYLQTLLDSAKGHAKLILTSRRQHFRSTAEVQTVLGKRVEDRAGSRVVILEEFSDTQILEFLAKRHPEDPGRARIRFELLRGIANLLDLAHNPRMLTFVAELDEERLRTAARNEAGEITAASLYRQIIDSWLSREEERHTHKQGLRPISKRERLDACTTLALRLWTSRLPQLALTDLSTDVTVTLRDLAERGYTDEEAVHSIASGSLLVRSDEGSTFTFIHESIKEWLVANAAADALGGQEGEQILANQQMSQLMAEFFTDLAGIEQALLWTTKTLNSPAASDIAKQNAMAIAARVGMKPGTRLAGVDLRGQDLFQSDLRVADLSGANLSGMTLHRTDLLGANLSGANLTGARLIEGSLQGANLAGSHWDRAVILGTAGLPDPATAPEIGRAAVLGRDPVEIMLPTPGTVTSVAFSPVSMLLAIGRASHVQLIDSETGQTLRHLTGNTEQVNDVAFSPDGSLIAAASNDQTVRIWEAATGIHHATLRGHSNQVGAVAFSPDGSLIATASDDTTARTWDTATGTLRTTFNGHSDWVRSVEFSPDGSLIATASRDRTARTWDTATATQRVTFIGHGSWVRRIAFSPDGFLVATASRDGSARIWEAATGVRRTTLSHFSGLNSVVFSPDGFLVATASRGGSGEIWDAVSGTSRHTLKSHTDWVRDIAFSADGTVIATASKDGTVCLWDSSTGAQRRTIGVAGRSPVKGVAFSPDGARIATASGGLGTRVWDAATGNGRAAVTLTGSDALTTAVAFSPDSSLIATASEDRTARIWDAATGIRLRTLWGHGGAVRDVAFSPDGLLVATASDDGTVRFWDSATGSNRGGITAHDIKVNAVAFSRNGAFIATASDDGTARIWSSAGHHPIATLFRWTPRPHAVLSHSATAVNLGAVTAVAFSPDSALLATASDDGVVRIFDTANGTRRRRLQAHASGVTAVAFSPDGTLLATASDDGTALIWKITTNAAPAIVSGHAGAVTAVAFSPDGALLATASDDTAVRIWQTGTGALRGMLIALPGGGNALLLTDRRYRVDDPGDDIWWAIKLCRFNPGELDPYVPGLRPVAEGEAIFPRLSRPDPQRPPLNPPAL